MNSLLFAIILVPVIEIYLFIKIGGQIGAFNTISLIFITAIIGCYNLKTDEIELSNAGHQPALRRTADKFIEYKSSSTPLAVTKQKNENVYTLEKFKLNGGRVYCFTDGFSESLDENKQEIGIEGVKDLINKHKNSSLKKELVSATEEIRQKSLKKDYEKIDSKRLNKILKTQNDTPNRYLLRKNHRT